MEGIDFVRCRICGRRLRVISGRHLSKHDIDREAYMEEYGLSPDELIAKDVRRLKSSRRGYRPYGRREWIAAMNRLHRANRNVFAGRLQDDYPHLYTQGCWIFGDWDTALRAAGLNPERARLRGFWDREKVAEEIRALQARHQPLHPKHVLVNRPKVFSGALRQYGSWTKALVAAGIAKEQIPPKRANGRRAVLRALRDAQASRDVPQSLKLHAAYYFGSLRKAVLAVRTEPGILNGWSKPRISALLSRLHRSKQNLAYAGARRDRPALVSAAEAYFGSWGEALHAAGIDPNQYFVHHKWRGPKR